jgi:hypothetical protein
VLWDAPPTYEFAGPLGGVYPPWMDPSYWYDGLTYHFDGPAEWTAFKANLWFCGEMFGWWFFLLLAAVLAFAGDVRSTLRALARSAGCWVPAAAGIVIYQVAVNLGEASLDSQPSQRYIAVFVVLLCLTTAYGLRLRPIRPSTMTRRSLAVGLSVAVLGVLGWLGAYAFATPSHARAIPPWLLAEKLESYGVAKGSDTATVGRPSYHVFWARLAGARIVADVPDETRFWFKPPAVRNALLDQLARVGARAIVSASPPVRQLDPGWRRVEGTTYAVRLLGQGS